MMYKIKVKSLSIEHQNEVHKWLQDHFGINTTSIRLHRKFSDVLPLAEMMKCDYPRLIDLNNYPKRSRVQLKIANWETFSLKVLKKLNLSLSRELMEMLSRGEPGAAEILLYEMMRLKKRQEVEHLVDNGINNNVKSVVITQQIGDAIIQMPQKMILYSLYEEVARNNLAKDAIIKEAEKHLEQLESIIKSKTNQLNELLMQDDHNSCEVTPSKSSSISLDPKKAQLRTCRTRHYCTPVDSSD